MKRVLIAIIVFLFYFGAVILAAMGLHFGRTQSIWFSVALGVLGALAIAITFWYLRRLESAPGEDAGATADSHKLRNLFRQANLRLRQSGRRHERSLASIPVLYVLGDENSAKTQVVVQSGLDAELLAGAVYRDQAVTPTDLVNIWLTGRCALVEAAGAMLTQDGLWRQLIRSTIPARVRSAFSRGSRTPPRAAVVCVSMERLMAPNTAEHIRALAQTINRRLRELSEGLGVSLPVYVLFTKLDTLAPFADYARHLSEEEVTLPLGSLLPALDAAEGPYTERAASVISTQLDHLLYAFSEFRVELFSRGGELNELGRAYEFPRDLRKLRSGLVSFLVDLGYPSQITINPFLRGFFFSGMRAHLVEDVAAVGPMQARTTSHAADGATRVFAAAGRQAEPAAFVASSRAGMRKEPQWVFLPKLFSHILLTDSSALDRSRASTRSATIRRIALATASAAILALLALSTISFFNNRSLANRAQAAIDEAAAPGSSAVAGSQAALQSTDRLRNILVDLETYRDSRPPVSYRFGLYQGNALLPAVCRAYRRAFQTNLLDATEAQIAARLRALPATPAPDANYGTTYRALKAYLISVAERNPDSPQDTLQFLPEALFEQWPGASSADPDTANLARAQFAFYSRELAAQTSCMNSAGGVRNEPLVQQARAYLNQFQGFQHVYQSMLAGANRQLPGIDFNGSYPGSAQYIVDNYTVAGAFTKNGYAFMQQAISHPEQYLGGEEWVLGQSTAAPIDRAALIAQLKSAYVADFVQTWRTYLNRAQFVGYRGFADAANKLDALDSNTSAILELFALASIHTAVPEPAIAGVFQAPQSVVPPGSADRRLIGSSNQSYIQALQGLEGAVKTLTLNPASASDPMAAVPIAQAAANADQAAESLRNEFLPDPGGGVDRMTFNILEAPIQGAKNLAAQAPAAAASGAAKAFCAQIAPTLAKFPFDPHAPQEASAEEVAQVFAPGQGSFAQFYNTSLRALIVQQGGRYFIPPRSAVRISPGFLAFLEKAQRISSVLFSSGGNQPSLQFSLTEVKAPGGADAVLSIDGKEIRAIGQTASFHWLSQPGSRITLATAKNTAPPFMGPWAIFHFAFAAPQVAPNRLKFFFSFNNQAPEVVLFDASGPGAPLLNPDFMRGFRCVSNVTR